MENWGQIVTLDSSHVNQASRGRHAVVGPNEQFSKLLESETGGKGETRIQTRMSERGTWNSFVPMGNGLNRLTG